MSTINLQSRQNSRGSSSMIWGPLSFLLGRDFQAASTRHQRRASGQRFGYRFKLIIIISVGRAVWGVWAVLVAHSVVKQQSLC
jgi:hypothetical protein